MGFLNTPELVELLNDTPKLADQDLDSFDALVVAGGSRREPAKRRSSNR
jgi:hypothetical protein